MKWHSFSEVVTDATSKFKKIKASDYHAQGRYKIIDQGKEPVAGYTDDANLVNGKLLPILIFGDHTRVLKYEEDPIALGADGAKALWVNTDLAKARYVYYYLRSIQIKEAGYSRHFKFLKEVEIPIPFKDGTPDFGNQIRIAYLLGKVEGLIAQRKRHLQQLDDLLKSLFLEMFGDPVRNEKGWPTRDLDSFIDQKRGISYGIVQRGENFPGGVPVLRIRDVISEEYFEPNLVRTDPSNSEKYARTTLQGGEVLLSIRGTVGAISIAPPHAIGWNVSRELAIIPVTHGVNKNYLVHLLKSLPMQRQFSSMIKGVAQSGLNLSDIRRINVILPRSEMQSSYEKISTKIESLVQIYRNSLTNLEALFGILSQQAFKGELDLSRVPITSVSAEEEQTVVIESFQASADESIAIILPNTDKVLDALESSEAREALMTQWLEAYRGRLGNTPFSARHFIAAAQTRLAELHPDTDFELGANDYEHIKNWVFDALAAGRLTQAFDDNGNCLQLKAAQA